MDTHIHNPKRTQCQTMHVEYTTRPHGYIGAIEFECQNGGSTTIMFESAEDIRNHAAALKLLAESLEEKQCEPTA